MPTDQKLDLLQAVPLFERLSKADLTRLGQLADEVDVPAGRVLMRQGDLGNQMFVIASGRVSVDRDGQRVRELGQGDWFGEIALLAEGTRTATVTATEPSRLFVVAHHDFHALMDDLPSVRKSVLDCLAGRLLEVDDAATN
jgi:CRP-like cAMP-binding protein